MKQQQTTVNNNNNKRYLHKIIKNENYILQCIVIFAIITFVKGDDNGQNDYGRFK